MPRDFEQIQRGQGFAEAAKASSDTLSLPPGYIQGFTVIMANDYTVTVGAGAANVQGIQVRLDAPHKLVADDWVVPRLDTPQHYYIYLAKDGHIWIDIVKPTYSDKWGYYEQADYQWRAIGKLFVHSNLVVFAGPEESRR